MPGEIIEATTTPSTALAAQHNCSADLQRVIAQKIAIQGMMGKVLHDNVHYGTVPGTVKEGEKPKKSLYKPGAETICMLFRLRPEYEVVTRREEPDFLAFEVRCRLYHIQTGELWGEGIGSVNSRESRYLNQIMSKVCPECGKPAIIRGKEEYGGGWLCYPKKDGCGAKFAIADARIVDQVGQIVSAKVWEMHNTLIKMGQKRAHVAATLTATAASDFFTQDLEDLEEAAEGNEGGERGTTGKATPVRAAGTPEVKPPRATPVQIRDLREALDALEIGIKAAADLKNGEREKVLSAARAAWVNGMLTSHEQAPVKAFSDLTPELALKLTEAARNGEMPPAVG